MQAEKILALSGFLAMSPKSYNEIAQFLVMNTFSEEKFLRIYMGEVLETGVLCAIGGFGWESGQFSAIGEIPLQTKLPITDAINSSKVLVKQSGNDFDLSFPITEELGIPKDWISEVSVPIYPIGGMTLYSSIEIELSEAMEIFFVAVGSLLGLYASRLPEALVEVARAVKEKIDLNQVPLSDRQYLIAGLLERGFNNSQIGLEIGFSESLVRQESVVIYRKLQVSGRKAMQAIQSLRLEDELSNIDE
jgi:DNA-binding CsgD family transcriptional regulator